MSFRHVDAADVMADITGNSSQVIPSIGERQMGEGLESSDTNVEELNYKRVQGTVTELLLRETISQLEKALYESTRLLSQRDNEILSLRSVLESSRRDRDSNISDTLDEEVKRSQRKVIDLEKTVQRLQQDVAMYEVERESLLKREREGNSSGHTCYCGSLCGAMKEMVELKKKLQVTEQKYCNLKRAFKSMERSKVRVGVAHRDSPCSIS